MVRLAISVEGKSDKEFIDRLLTPHLAHASIRTTAIVLQTKRRLTGEKFTGGDTNIDRVASEVRRLLPNFDQVSTFYDLYAFGDRRPGESPSDLESRISRKLENPAHFTAYTQSYELEALLFSSPVAVAAYFDQPELADRMNKALRSCGAPELVNDDKSTSPKSRLIVWTSGAKGRRYDQVIHAAELAVRISLPTIRAACPRFDGWVTKLESLGRAS